MTRLLTALFISYISHLHKNKTDKNLIANECKSKLAANICFCDVFKSKHKCRIYQMVKRIIINLQFQIIGSIKTNDAKQFNSSLKEIHIEHVNVIFNLCVHAFTVNRYHWFGKYIYVMSWYLRQRSCYHSVNSQNVDQTSIRLYKYMYLSLTGRKKQKQITRTRRTIRHEWMSIHKTRSRPNTRLLKWSPIFLGICSSWRLIQFNRLTIL